jgi:hypothetical protein
VTTYHLSALLSPYSTLASAVFVITVYSVHTCSVPFASMYGMLILHVAANDTTASWALVRFRTVAPSG